MKQLVIKTKEKNRLMVRVWGNSDSNVKGKNSSTCAKVTLCKVIITRTYFFYLCASYYFIVTRKTLKILVGKTVLAGVIVV